MVLAILPAGNHRPTYARGGCERPPVRQTGRVRDVVILGSTGSIGTQALEVIAAAPERFRVVGLAAGGGQVALLARQALDTGVEVVGVTRATAVQDLQLAFYAEASKRGWATGGMRLPRILAGPDAATEVARLACDVVLNGITGSAGLAPTLAALSAGSILALANKESLVVGGPLVTRAAAAGPTGGGGFRTLRVGAVPARRVGRRGRPADPHRQRRAVPRSYPGAAADVTPAEALAHPTWDMGRVITTNSRNPGQQGPGAAGGPPAVRRRPGPDRRRGPSAVDRALDGAVRRRLDAGPVLAAGHEAADRARSELAGTAARAWPGRATGRTAAQLDLRAAGRRGVPGGRAGPPGRVGSAARRPRSSTPPTRMCVDAFHDGRIGFLGDRRRRRAGARRARPGLRPARALEQARAADGDVRSSGRRTTSSRSSACWRPTPGPGSGPARW